VNHAATLLEYNTKTNRLTFMDFEKIERVARITHLAGEKDCEEELRCIVKDFPELIDAKDEVKIYHFSINSVICLV
jgi:hypothetical protein